MPNPLGSWAGRHGGGESRGSFSEMLKRAQAGQGAQGAQGPGMGQPTMYDPNDPLPNWATKWGMHEYLMPGGRYSPENVMAMAPQMQAPSPAGMMRYGMGAMDLAGRGAAVQAGHAASGLGGLSPAARVAALSRISQAAGAGMGQAGLQGMMQGGQLLQGANLANLQMQGGLLGQALGTGAQMAMTGMQTDVQKYMAEQAAADQRRRDREAARAARWGAVGGLFGQIGSTAAGMMAPMPQMQAPMAQPGGMPQMAPMPQGYGAAPYSSPYTGVNIAPGYQNENMMLLPFL